MPATTEIAILDLIAGSEVGDPSNPAAAVLKECGDTLSQQDGMQQMQFGTGVENPSTLQLFINWDAKADHEKFMASDAYQPFLNRFGTIFTGTPQIVHVDFKPDGGINSALAAPVTEVATFYFDGQPPDNAFEGAQKLVEAIKKDPSQNIHGWAYGITQEEIEKDGVKGKGGVLTIGWDSVEAHMKARETQAFKDNIQYLRNEVKGAEVHHVQTMQYIAN